MKKEQKSNIDEIGKIIEEKKKMPKEIIRKINAKTFENVVLLALIIIYLVSLNFGMTNISTDMYIMDLRVFSIMLLAISLIMFEYGYKNDNGEVWLHGVEVVVIATFTLYLIYLYSMFYWAYWTVLSCMGIVYLTYYAIKILVVQRRIETEYKKSLRDINEIVK